MFGRTAVLTVALLGLLFVPVPAGAHHGGFHNIRNKDWDATCLEVDDGRGTSGAAVAVDWCSQKGLHQQWPMELVEGSYYLLRPRHNPGMCLAVYGASHNDGARITQLACDRTSWSQQWKVAPPGPVSWSPFVARHSGKCLDKSGWSVVQWNCHGVDWQKWAFWLV